MSDQLSPPPTRWVPKRGIVIEAMAFDELRGVRGAVIVKVTGADGITRPDVIAVDMLEAYFEPEARDG